ncbi:hypothetical protein MPSEU_000518200 [Mayamaea pseudoterrestris]|nr:hypothetical protein MPSEU_000518200 [Mayamaea pseudoterrestris]
MNSSPFEHDGLSENLLGPSYDFQQSGTSHRSQSVDHCSYEPLTPPTFSTTQHVSTGSKQPAGFRDIGPGLVFIVHIISIVYMAFVWGIPSLHYQFNEQSSKPDDRSIYYHDDDNAPSSSTTYNTTIISFGGMLAITTLSSFMSLFMTAAVAWVLTHFMSQIIQIALYFCVAANALLIIYFGTIHLWSGVLLSTLLLLFGAVYARGVWKRIPLATANLTAAVAALQANAGVAFVAYGMVAVFSIYTYLFLLAWLGVYLGSATCHAAEEDYCDSNMNVASVLYFIVSFYWTAHVIKNLLHVTVAGLVATWFFAPTEASQFCSPAILDSFSRASTFSFGSVCLGSLLTALLQIMHTMTREAVRHGQGSSLVVCVLQCLLGFLDRLVAYFNKYAMVYVGLYGYDYMTAGKKTADLFAARGWTLILNDDLVGRVLMLLNFVIGILTGAFGMYLAAKHPSWYVISDLLCHS